MNEYPRIMDDAHTSTRQMRGQVNLVFQEPGKPRLEAASPISSDFRLSVRSEVQGREWKELQSGSPPACYDNRSRVA